MNVSIYSCSQIYNMTYRLRVSLVRISSIKRAKDSLSASIWQHPVKYMIRYFGQQLESRWMGLTIIQYLVISLVYVIIFYISPALTCNATLYHILLFLNQLCLFISGLASINFQQLIASVYFFLVKLVSVSAIFFLATIFYFSTSIFFLVKLGSGLVTWPEMTRSQVFVH